jgi:hypothetical protein
MADDAVLLRVDSTGTVHPVGRAASQQLRARVGSWRLLPSPQNVLLMRAGDGTDAPLLRMAGEIRTPGALCDVIAVAAQSAWTGEILVLEAGTQRSIYLDGGTVIGASTNVADERLGETLYRFGVVTREQLESAIKASAESGKRIGEAAIELEYVSPEDLFPMMARQVEEVFYAALRVGEGMFYVFDRYDESQLPRRHNMNAGALLMEGARRMDEMHFFREKIPNEDYIPVPKPHPSEMKPPDDLAEVYGECDGKRSIAAIGRRIGQLEFEVTRAVFQLLRGGFLTMHAPRPEGPEAIIAAFNPALIEIHKRCDGVGKGAELRDGLSRFATGGGIFDPLFMGAGPLDDGSFRPERIARNLGALAGDDPDTWLIQLMQEYVGFALFQAGSLLPRGSESALATYVAEALKPLRSLDAAATPPSRM